jgi:hypothetical protein
MAFPSPTLDVGVLRRAPPPRSRSASAASVASSSKDDPKDADWTASTGCSLGMNNLGFDTDDDDEEMELERSTRKKAARQKPKGGKKKTADAIGGKRKRAASPSGDSSPSKKVTPPLVKNSGMKVSGLMGRDQVGIWYAPQTHMFAYKSGDEELQAEVLEVLKEAKKEWDAVRGCECEIWHAHVNVSTAPSVVAGMTPRFVRKTIPVDDSKPSSKRARGD